VSGAETGGNQVKEAGHYAKKLLKTWHQGTLELLKMSTYRYLHNMTIYGCLSR